MGKDFTAAKMEIRNMLKKANAYDPTKEPLIEIAAAQKVLHRKIIDDIERLKSPVVRDNEDLDYVAGPDEAVKLLPKVAKEYHNALVALGLAADYVADPKPGRPAKSVASSDRDELEELMRAARGEAE